MAIVLNIVGLTIREAALSPVPVPTPEHNPELVASIHEYETKSDPIDEPAANSHESLVPIPEPPELLDTTDEFQIVTLSMGETPACQEAPAPTPEPDLEQSAWICESKIK
jgi:hypothetical protein